jgi:hypothetical protein
MDEKSIGV